MDVLTLTANGELQAKIEPASGGEGSDTTWYSYDAFGNLVQVRMPRQKDGGQANGDVIEYVVDAQNRRVGKKLNGTLVKGWLYEGQLRPVAELDAAGNVTARYVYGAKVNIPEYIIKGSVTYRVITDHLGSVRLVVDQTTGSVAQQMEYDEWGNVLMDSNSDFTPFGFAGGVRDSQTRTTRFGERDYDPVVGRWMAKDPIRFEAGVSNLYEYTISDPLGSIDPDGLQGLGITLSVPAEIGMRIGLGGTGSLGGGVFWGGQRGTNLGGYAAGGGFAGDPSEDRQRGIVGGFVGAGLGAFYTTATCAAQLEGPFKTYSVNIGIGPIKVSFQYSVSGHIKLYSVTYGPGIGLSGSGYTTYTKATR